MVSKDIMNQRIDNYIKNVFTTLKKEYPTVQFYAYDVANECFADGQPGGLRTAGWNWQNGESPWNLIYGDDSYLEVAFASARKYAPDGCKLFYNDYNEYENPKMNNIYNLVARSSTTKAFSTVLVCSLTSTQTTPVLHSIRRLSTSIQASAAQST